MAVVDTTAGFKFSHRQSGQPPTIMTLYFKDTETLTKGDLVNAESGELDLAATNDAALLGAVQQTLAGVDSTTLIEVIVDEDAVYSVYDANARKIGDVLDIAGATGAMGVTTDSSHDVIVVANSAADELTLVKILSTKHATHV